uniref:Uncharacterized protein n=1 Tax=Cacopsylla melanoneura TaxID=428564 RepID=A0A8D9E8R2_9HEMI
MSKKSSSDDCSFKSSTSLTDPRPIHPTTSSASYVSSSLEPIFCDCVKAGGQKTKVSMSQGDPSKIDYDYACDCVCNSIPKNIPKTNDGGMYGSFLSKTRVLSTRLPV